MLKVGILGCADIAVKRFIPAALRDKSIEICLISEEYNPSLLTDIQEKFCIETVNNFDSVINSREIDAIYIPQPPALHYNLALRSLKAGKHVFLEKPATLRFDDTKTLVNVAKEMSLVLLENYMFKYHSQLTFIKKAISENMLGSIRLIRAEFGFPERKRSDFRYSKELGGGAFYDAGGYPLKLATELLGNKFDIICAYGIFDKSFLVDIGGSFTLKSVTGIYFQANYGMSNSYRCSLDIWGSTGSLFANRIFTAPANLKPEVYIKIDDKKECFDLDSCCHFGRSIETFVNACNDSKLRKSLYDEILLQSSLSEVIRNEVGI